MFKIEKNSREMEENESTWADGLTVSNEKRKRVRREIKKVCPNTWCRLEINSAHWARHVANCETKQKRQCDKCAKHVSQVNFDTHKCEKKERAERKVECEFCGQLFYKHCKHIKHKICHKNRALLMRAAKWASNKKTKPRNSKLYSGFKEYKRSVVSYFKLFIEYGVLPDEPNFCYLSNTKKARLLNKNHYILKCFGVKSNKIDRKTRQDIRRYTKRVSTCFRRKMKRYLPVQNDPQEGNGPEDCIESTPNFMFRLIDLPKPIESHAKRENVYSDTYFEEMDKIIKMELEFNDKIPEERAKWCKKYKKLKRLLQKCVARKTNKSKIKQINRVQRMLRFAKNQKAAFMKCPYWKPLPVESRPREVFKKNPRISKKHTKKHVKRVHKTLPVTEEETRRKANWDVYSRNLYAPPREASLVKGPSAWCFPEEQIFVVKTDKIPGTKSIFYSRGGIYSGFVKFTRQNARCSAKEDTVDEQSEFFDERSATDQSPTDQSATDQSPNELLAPATPRSQPANQMRAKFENESKFVLNLEFLRNSSVQLVDEMYKAYNFCVVECGEGLFGAESRFARDEERYRAIAMSYEMCIENFEEAKKLIRFERESYEDELMVKCDWELALFNARNTYNFDTAIEVAQGWQELVTETWNEFNERIYVAHLEATKYLQLQRDNLYLKIILSGYLPEFTDCFNHRVAMRMGHHKNFGCSFGCKKNCFKLFNNV